MTDTSTEAPALPGDGLRESIVDDLRRHIGDGLVEFLLKPQDDLWIRIAADKWAAAGRALQTMGFEYFCFLSGIDWKPSPFGRGEDDPTQPPPERKTEVVQGYAGGATRFQVFARVTDIKRHVGVTLKVDVDDPTGDGRALAIDSWHAIYAGANWHERETHEMYGISFTGHPDLRNIYLPTEFEGYPLRKDFPLLARIVKPWPGIVDVEPMPTEEVDGDEPAADATAAEVSPPVEGTPEAAPETAADPATVTDETAESAPAPEAAEPTDEAPAADALPVADVTPAADVEPVEDADIPTVAGTADEVEAVAEAAADEARAADQVAAVADVPDSSAPAPVPPSEDAANASLEEPATESTPEPDPSASATPDTNLVPGPFPGAVEPPADGSMPAGYEIKGNAQSMLFHVPGSQYYDAARAEYWFDTEESARAAGFLKPGETRD